MFNNTSRRATLHNFAGMVLMLSAPWLAPAPSPAAELSQVHGARPPGFSLPDLAGQQRSLGEFSGKVVLVTFWASWCSPCIEEMPSIRRLAATMADQPFTVVGVNVGEGERRAQAAAGRLGIGFPVLLDKDSTVFNGWGADVLPTAYLLDRSGRIRYIARGPVDWDRADIIGMLKQLAAEQPG
jgi:peroxiredoxin